MAEISMGNAIKKVSKFALETVVTIISGFIALFIGFCIFSSIGIDDNSFKVTEAQQQLESVQAQVSEKENEKATLEAKVNELTESNNKLINESTDLKNKLEELKNTKIQ